MQNSGHETSHNTELLGTLRGPQRVHYGPSSPDKSILQATVLTILASPGTAVSAPSGPARLWPCTGWPDYGPSKSYQDSSNGQGASHARPRDWQPNQVRANPLSSTGVEAQLFVGDCSVCTVHAAHANTDYSRGEPTTPQEGRKEGGKKGRSSRISCHTAPPFLWFASHFFPGSPHFFKHSSEKSQPELNSVALVPSCGDRGVIMHGGVCICAIFGERAARCMHCATRGLVLLLVQVLRGPNPLRPERCEARASVRNGIIRACEQ